RAAMRAANSSHPASRHFVHARAFPASKGKKRSHYPCCGPQMAMREDLARDIMLAAIPQMLSGDYRLRAKAGRERFHPSYPCGTVFRKRLLTRGRYHEPVPILCVTGPTHTDPCARRAGNPTGEVVGAAAARLNPPVQACGISTPVTVIPAEGRT